MARLRSRRHGSANDTCFFIAVLLIIATLMAFVLFYYDKHAAQDRLWRVSENTLLLVALIGGSVGAIIGQQVMRHKTGKEPFRTMLYSIPVLQIIAFGWFVVEQPWQ